MEPSKNATTFDRRIKSCDDNGNGCNEYRQKSLRRSSSIFSPTLSLAQIVLILQTLIYFQILLVDGTNTGTQNQNRRRDAAETSLRYVRREIMLEEELIYNDPFDGDPFEAEDSSPEANDASANDGSFLFDDEDYDTLTMSNSTDDYVFDDFNLTEAPTESNPFFAPVAELPDPDDKLSDLWLSDPPSYIFFDCNCTVNCTANCTSNEPSLMPTLDPTNGLTNIPTNLPTNLPTDLPTNIPTFGPTDLPTNVPTFGPTDLPTNGPTFGPTDLPTLGPTDLPTNIPTSGPTFGPTGLPTNIPTFGPTNEPTAVASQAPTVPFFPPVDILGPDDDDDTDILFLEPSVSPSDDTDGRLDLSGGPTVSPVSPVAPPIAAPIATPPPTLPPTEIPSSQPSGFPTTQPTPFPTPIPTSFPTFNPTFNPTPVPSPGPTPGPTPFPTLVPTPLPTNFPTFNPTPVPSPGPTNLPTFPPTPVPTDPPIPGPTDPPTFVPTPVPTDPPTPGPTDPPTPVPTFAPTPVPSPGPSARPTPVPTRSPTANPTPVPTRSPTARPSSSPTFSPTLTRSEDPTPSGSLEPTVSPEPTPAPSISSEPTNYPTVRPTPSPTFAPTLQMFVGEVTGEMELTPLAEQLRGTDTITWETVTESIVEQWMVSAAAAATNVRSSTIYDRTVRANIEDQYQVSMSKAPPGGTRRHLQEENSVIVESLVIQFKVIMQYRSSEESDANELFGTAFDTPAKQAEYIDALQRGSTTFSPVNEAKVNVDGWVPPPTQAPTPEPVKNNNIAVIAGASVGAVALLIIVVLVAFRKRGKSVVEESKGIEVTLATPSTGKNIKVSTEILVEPQDDVSTLGDPMFGQGGMIMGGIDRDEMTATVGDDYDYTKHYRNMRGPMSLAGTANTRDRTISEDMSKMSSVQSVSLRGVGKMGESIFADDSSFEEQFKEIEQRIDVVAPAGKLGMVIDTPNGGIPVVHAIKDTSVLIDQVRVGDRLLSVDGEDCTGMTAMQVSKLISLKSSKPARVLVFARTPANAPTK
eukprot:CAMPEP_0116124074 /NCGR_PEP_ID=MMETSP0329-20121206/5092_1 /TAXON_ID=697910 /ORGANISM="Pseudo-nitzschia arenysensis, Strain B593" /LENGTH=1027 /DNA_ID=CAMNT_0003618041 /DNA_START=170 /DNA_END=3253 /DNA_ORIENTATION=-